MSSHSSFRYSLLGSGSEGNGLLISTPGAKLLVDCGFTLQETEARLAQRGVDPSELTALLVTHEHGDHIGGVARLAKRYALPVYLTRGTSVGLKGAISSQLQFISGGDCWVLGDLTIQAVTVPHDSREPVQFVFRHEVGSLGLLTDLGHVSANVKRHFCDLNALILEFNHDQKLLRNGPYPPSLKRRVGGLHGHLSNDQAHEWLVQLAANTNNGLHIVAAHLSQQNNSEPLVAHLLTLATPENKAYTYEIATQHNGSEWRYVAARPQPAPTPLQYEPAI